MPSKSHDRWATTRRDQSDEIERAHAASGGTRPGRRYATQQLNQAYVVMLASQFQGFCRDLHSESVDFLVPHAQPVELQPIIRDLLTQNLQLNRSNAQPGSIGADFGRFGIEFWPEVELEDPRNGSRKALLDELNGWRNAIAHQDFGSRNSLKLKQVRRWRGACGCLAVSFDTAMRRQLHHLTGAWPW
jgi:hypothetical protein